MRDILLASMCGTLINVGPAIPVELVKTRLQVGDRVDCKRYNQEGNRNFLKIPEIQVFLTIFLLF